MEGTSALAQAPSVARMSTTEWPVPGRGGLPVSRGRRVGVGYPGQVRETVTTLAAGLFALGLEPEDRVAIASSTRIEWIYADLAITCAGGATTTVYPTTGAEDIAFILADSGSRIVFAEDDVQSPSSARCVTGCRTGARRHLRRDPGRRLGAGPGGPAGPGRQHLAKHPTAVDDAVAAIQPEHLATLIYTSGTTGQPKGVELPHRCWTYMGAGAEALDILSRDDLQFLWLPLSHSFGKMLEAVQLQIGFPTAVDGRMDKIVENLASAAHVHGRATPASSRRCTARSCRPSRRRAVSRARSSRGPSGSGPGAQERLAGTPARGPWRVSSTPWPTGWCFEGPGPAGRAHPVPHLRQCRALTRGADWFYAAGMLILEGYGLTETSAGACSSGWTTPCSGGSGRRSRAPRSASPRTARSCCGGPA